MNKQTISEYRKVIKACKEVFENKTKDYGTAWRILRISSVTDLLFIKAKRVRSIQEKGLQQIQDSVADEFIGMINYCVMAIMQLELPEQEGLEISYDKLSPVYDKIVEESLELLTKKNHDYGEAWRDMRVSSITDIILMKILRIKQIEDNQGATIISEGIKANYQDIINYAVFTLIKLNVVKNEVNDQ